MSQLSTFFPTAVSATSLGLGTSANVTFGSVTTGAVTASGTVSGTGFDSYLAAPPAIGNTTPSTGAFTTLTLADGTRFLPSFFFANDTDTGFFRRGINTMTFVTSGASRFEVSGQGPRIASADSLSWALNTDLTGSTDLSLFRDAADMLAQRRGTNAQEFRVYNTFTSATNHERGFLKWSSNSFIIGTEAGSGGGSQRNMIFRLATGRTLFCDSDTIDFRSATFNTILRLTTTLVQFSGTTASFPALKRSSTTLQGRLADDSDFASVQGKLTTETAYTAGAPTATGYLVVYDSNGTAYKVPAEAL